MGKPLITYQFKLKSTKSQLTEFSRQLEVHRHLYNRCLEQKIEAYNRDKTNLSCFDLIKSEVPRLKGQSNSASLQQTIRRLDKAYQKFFKQGAGFPRFKAKNSFNTIAFATLGDGCKIHANNIYIQGLGLVKAKFHRQIPLNCKPKSLSITLNASGLFVNIVCENLVGKFNKANKAIGVDFGSKSTITFSNGKSETSPELMKSKLKNLARLNRQKSKLIEIRKSQKLSHIQQIRLNQLRTAISHIYAKMTNKRKDFNHKLSQTVVNAYSVICLEDLSVEDITTKPSEKMAKQKSTNINRRLYDIGICQLKTFICYKAENAGSTVVLVAPPYTTQTCSQCGKIKPKDVDERTHVCECGLKLDRDHNAAINILRLGLKSLAKISNLVIPKY